MHAILTTLAGQLLTSWSASFHHNHSICRSHQFSGQVTASLVDYRFSACNLIERHDLSYNDEIRCVCGGRNGYEAKDKTATEFELIETYVYFRQIGGSDWVENWQLQIQTQEYSCILYDSSYSEVHLMSDRIGSVPLFFSFSSNSNHASLAKFIATTDAVAASRLGFFELDILAPSQIIRINLNSNEILSVNAIRVAVIPDKFQHKSIDAFALQLYSTALSAIAVSLDAALNHFANNSAITVVTENDISITSSNLMQSLLADIERDAYERNKFRINVVSWQRPSLVALELPSFFKSLDGDINEQRLFHHVMAEMDDFRSLKTSIWEPSLLQIAAFHYGLCLTAKHQQNGVLVSFDSGHESHSQSRSLNIFFQNMFCGLLNVPIVYPFLDWRLNQLLSSSPRAHSYLQQSVDYLVGQRFIWLDNQMIRTFKNSEQSNSQETIVAEAFNVANPLRLWNSIWRHIGRSGQIFVVVATYGYLDMLANFLMSANNTMQPQTYLPILVLTDDQRVCQLADTFKAATYLIGGDEYMGIYRTVDSSRNADFSTTDDAPSECRDFGTISYQELILTRTECVMDLLLMGFSPIVADIDTVWLQDPLAVIGVDVDSKFGPNYQYDMLVTDDHGEICGCFVYIRPSSISLQFWSELLYRHRSLIEDARANQRVSLKRDVFHLDKQEKLPMFKFSDSEQKILSQMILDKQFSKISSIKIVMMSPERFPSGFDFFNIIGGVASKHFDISSNTSIIYGAFQRSFSTRKFENRDSIFIGRQQTPIIIHNNFLVGKTAKKFRFERQGLWKVFPPLCEEFLGLFNPLIVSAVSMDSLVHGYQPHIVWAQFGAIYDRLSYPSLNMIVPVHDDVVQKQTLVQITTEGLTMAEGAGKLWVEVVPPTSIDFAVMGVYELVLHRNNAINGFSAILKDSNLQVFVDVARNRSSFAFDRSGKFDREANEFVYQSERVQPERMPSLHELLLSATRRRLEQDSVAGYSMNKSNYSNFHLTASIKVLAFNRPNSLKRLLDSLSKAHYLGQRVSLEIYVDFNRTIEEGLLVRETRLVAEEFRWDHGLKSITARESNQGLHNQWFNSWAPVDENELAFVFEDDIEVSPLFFSWAMQAAAVYYGNSPQQRELHRSLLATVRASVQRHRARDKFGGDADHDPLEQFLRASAGRPLLYGICLQKQHLDPAHYPLDVLTPIFAGSLIGSWGPLFFPIVWTAFKEWWLFKLSDLKESPVVEHTVLNYFMNQNPRLWTPWMARFAYETGAKCLYSNLPGNLSLVVNFRDAGENYHESKGAIHSILSEKLVQESNEAAKNIAKSQSFANQTYPPIDWEQAQRKWFLLKLFFSTVHFPSVQYLLKWQIDFNQRRAGCIAGACKLYKYASSSREEVSFNLCLSLSEVDLSPASPHCDLQLSESTYAYLFREHSINWFGGTNRSVVRFCPFLLYCSDGDSASDTMSALVGDPEHATNDMNRLLHVISAGTNLLLSLKWQHIEVIFQQLLVAHNFPANSRLIHLGVNPLLPLAIRTFASNELFLLGTPARQGSSVNPCAVVEMTLRQRQFVFSRELSQSLSISNRFLCRQLLNSSLKLVDAKDASHDTVIVLPLQLLPLQEMHEQAEAAICNILDYAQPSVTFPSLLALGLCASAPTELHFRCPALLPGKKNSIYSFYFYEDVCVEDKTDVGGVLYRLRDRKFREPVRISRRLSEGVYTSILDERKFSETFL